MLVIRLKRKGKKNQPFFRVVVTDKRKAAKGGRTIDDLGYFDPLTKRSALNKERVLHWLKVGAKPSDTVHNMIISEKIIEGNKINLTKKSKKPIDATQSKPVQAASVAAAPAVSVAETPAAPAAQSVPVETQVAAPVAPVETPVVEQPAEQPKAEEVKPAEQPVQ